MVTYMTMPRNQIVIGGSTTQANTILSATITRLENGFDTATIELPDNNSAFYPDTITNNTSIQLDVKNESDVSYTTCFKGVCRFPKLPLGNNEIIVLKCDGSGYGLSDTVCNQEYGSQSRNPTLDTLAEILTDSTYGIITKYVNKILGSSTDSGFAYNTDNVETITGTVPYLYYPYKPCNKSIDDLADLITALNAGDAGPHWIVTTDDKFRIKLISATQTGWTTYYGNSQANSTLVQGTDFIDFNFEPIGPEANYIIYNGIWQRPSNADWTEGNYASWDDGSGATFSDEGTIKLVGNYSVKSYYAAATGCGFKFTFPEQIDLSYFSSENIPSLNFDLATDRVMTAASGAGIYNNFFVRLFSNVSGAYYTYINPGNDSISKGSSAGDINFQHFNFQVGKYSKDKWLQPTNSVEWDSLEQVEIWCPNVQSAYLDGFNFGGAQVTRIAKNSTNITANKVKMKVITDRTPKDDTLTSGTPGTTDLGLMAQLAYSELLRLQKSAIVGYVTVPMIKDALPGQYFHIHAKKKSDGTFTINKDMRATKITHNISNNGYFSVIELTDDLTNSHARTAYEDRNKIMAATQPDFQNRQATSIKAGDIDIRVTPLEEDYAS